jgi:putative membrane protein
MAAEHHALVQAWSLPVTLALSLIALVYSCGWVRLRIDSPNTIPAWRAAVFLSGMVFLWVVVGSPLSALDHHALTVHMIDHLLLMTVVAPLILLAAPGRPLLQGLPAWLGQSVNFLIAGNREVQRVGSILTNPVFCWLFATATVIGWHLPAVFHLAVRFRAGHDLEYASFILAGLLFWLPVVQCLTDTTQQPRWSMPVYLFLATLPCDILSAFLVFCGRVVYPSYLSANRIFNRSALQDQQCAGALMWVWVTFAYLLPAFVITVQLLSPERRDSQQTMRLAHPLAQALESLPASGSPAEVA